MNQFKLWLLLILFFIILSESFTLLNIVIGVLVATIVIWLSRGQLPNLSSFNIRSAGLWLWFILVLIKEVIMSNIQVAKVVLSKEMPIAPEIVDYTSKLKDNFLLTVYANVITLTPGTMTVEIQGPHFQVHCLSPEYAEGLTDSKLEQILLKIEEGVHA